MEVRKILELESLISKLDGLRTLFVYDSVYAIRSLLFNHLIPHFKYKNVYIAIYTETMYRRLEMFLKSYPKESLKDINIIKIGLKKETTFGKLYEFISETTWYRKFINTIKKLGKNDVLILHGFSILPIIEGRKGLTDIIRLLDSVDKDLTVIGKYADKLYDEKVKALLERFYDVVIRVSRFKENYFDLNYSIEIDQSIIADLIPGNIGRFKIENGKLVRIC